MNRDRVCRSSNQACHCVSSCAMSWAALACNCASSCAICGASFEPPSTLAAADDSDGKLEVMEIRVRVTATREADCLPQKAAGSFKLISYTSIWPLPFIKTKPCDTDLKYPLVETLASAPMPCVTRMVPEFENLHMRAAVFTVSPATSQLLSLQKFMDFAKMCKPTRKTSFWGKLSMGESLLRVSW